MKFVLIFGPPAVGKMTVGEELCARTGFKLFRLPGLVFTFVWGLDLQNDTQLVGSYASRRHLLELDEGYVLNTSSGHRTLAAELLERRAYVRIDNSDLPAVQVADAIIEAFAFDAVA